MVEQHKPKKIPTTLENLFQEADFISLAGDNDKICFKDNKYVQKSSWLGSFMRMNSGETSGNLIRRIKDIQTQLFEQYTICTDEDFVNLILSKLIALRNACIRLRDTTYSGEKFLAVKFDSIIRSIEVGLPGRIKESQGIPKIGTNLYFETPFTPVTTTTVPAITQVVPPSTPVPSMIPTTQPIPIPGRLRKTSENEEISITEC